MWRASPLRTNSWRMSLFSPPKQRLTRTAGAVLHASAFRSLLFFECVNKKLLKFCHRLNSLLRTNLQTFCLSLTCNHIRNLENLAVAELWEHIKTLRELNRPHEEDYSTTRWCQNSLSWPCQRTLVVYNPPALQLSYGYSDGSGELTDAGRGN